MPIEARAAMPRNPTGSQSVEVATACGLHAGDSVHVAITNLEFARREAESAALEHMNRDAVQADEWRARRAKVCTALAAMRRAQEALTDATGLTRAVPAAPKKRKAAKNAE